MSRLLELLAYHTLQTRALDGTADAVCMCNRHVREAAFANPALHGYKEAQFHLFTGLWSATGRPMV